MHAVEITAQPLRAGRTQAEELHRMTDLRVAVFGCNGVSPLFDGRPGNLDSGAAGSADQMVMMFAAALAIDAFALIVDQLVDLAGRGERLKGTVDGSEADGDAAVAKIVMELLR